MERVVRKIIGDTDKNGNTDKNNNGREERAELQSNMFVARVAAYCRVSTKSKGQERSYDTQVAVYTQMINSTPGWTLAGIYADNGLSGTQANRRPNFLRMIEDCEAGLIDIIICKSISRFSRNSMDALAYIRKLKDLGIRIIFEKEDIDTANLSSEMLISVFSAFAQEESQTLSENVKWGKRKRIETGQIPSYPPYGFKENLEIVPKEAEVVKQIFDMYEHGISINNIIKFLMDGKIKPPGYRYSTYSGSMVWDKTRIHYIIQNEKYVGDIRTQKRYSTDFITHKSRVNKGILPQLYFRDHHEGFISRKQFERCSKIHQMRLKTPYQSYPFGEMLHCPYCGHVLIAHKMGAFHNDRHFCCEGNEACRKFVIRVKPVEDAILKAFNVYIHSSNLSMIDNGMVNAGSVFDRIDFWWLDEFVERIEFGKHTWLYSQLKKLPVEEREAVNDCVIHIFWRDGTKTTVPLDLKSDWQNPMDRARRWDEFLRRKRQENTQCPLQRTEETRSHNKTIMN